MAEKSVALFGHYKPRYELRKIEKVPIKQVVAHGYHGEPWYYEAASWAGYTGMGYAGTGYTRMTPDISKAAFTLVEEVVSHHVEEPTGFDDKLLYVYNVTGWEKRAEPGDVIAVQPLSHEPKWVPNEEKGFLIVRFGGLTDAQTGGITEPVWDTESANEELAGWTQKQIDELKEPYYLYPSAHLKKRRFHIPLADLEALGVDLAKMLDTKTRYRPALRSIGKLEGYDKLNGRYVLSTDELKTLEPLVLEPGKPKPDPYTVHPDLIRMRSIS